MITPASRSRLARGPAAVRERSLAPDLARGCMLLLIAVANTPLFLAGHGAEVRNHPGGSALDNAVNLVIITAVDGRAYPMFSALFGYGMVQLLARQEAAGTPRQATEKLLNRRHLWMLLFGAAHGILLFSGDIIGTYALAGIVLGWLLFRRDRDLLVGAAVLAIPMVVVSTAVGFATALLPPVEQQSQAGQPFGPTLPDNVLPALLLRVAAWPAGTLFTVLSCVVLVPILLGAWAARRRLLDEPERQVRLLRRVTAAGIGVAVAGGLPLGIVGARLWQPSAPVEGVLLAVHTITGIAGGLGYAALFGLVSVRLGARRGVVSGALAATGQRSMSCYLAQSVVFVPLLAPWALGLGARLHSASMALFAVAVWVLTVVAAAVAARVGYRGPAEKLLRRLTYSSYSSRSS